MLFLSSSGIAQLFLFIAVVFRKKSARIGFTAIRLGRLICFVMQLLVFAAFFKVTSIIKTNPLDDLVRARR